MDSLGWRVWTGNGQIGTREPYVRPGGYSGFMRSLSVYESL
jgi:hypothetical protein